MAKVPPHLYEPIEKDECGHNADRGRYHSQTNLDALLLQCEMGERR